MRVFVISTRKYLHGSNAGDQLVHPVSAFYGSCILLLFSIEVSGTSAVDTAQHDSFPRSAAAVNAQFHATIHYCDCMV